MSFWPLSNPRLLAQRAFGRDEGPVQAIALGRRDVDLRPRLLRPGIVVPGFAVGADAGVFAQLAKDYKTRLAVWNRPWIPKETEATRLWIDQVFRTAPSYDLDNGRHSFYRLVARDEIRPLPLAGAADAGLADELLGTLQQLGGTPPRFVRNDIIQLSQMFFTLSRSYLGRIGVTALGLDMDLRWQGQEARNSFHTDAYGRRGLRLLVTYFGQPTQYGQQGRGRGDFSGLLTPGSPIYMVERNAVSIHRTGPNYPALHRLPPWVGGTRLQLVISALESTGKKAAQR